MCKHRVDSDAVILKVKPDGACGFHSGAGHIFENPGEGLRLRGAVNNHMADCWNSHYRYKVSFPYKRQVGVHGKWVEFHQEEQYLKFLRSSEEAVYLYQEANLYQMQIKVITMKNDVDGNPVVSNIGPDPRRCCTKYGLYAH